MDTAVIILAAGQGSRMRSDLPKVLHTIGGAPILIHAMRGARALQPKKTVIVAGHGAEAVEAAARSEAPEAEVVLQAEQRGTAHATAQAAPALEDFAGDAVVLYGDTPFVSPETFGAIRAARESADLVVLGFHASEPGGYGRLVTEGERLVEIVEAKDASPDVLAIRLCNSGIMAASAKTLFSLIEEIGSDNAQGEYYLTDAVGIATERGLTTRVVTCDEAETLGSNSRADLARAEAGVQDRARDTAMAEGATLRAPDTVYFSHDTELGADVEIGPNVIFGPGVTVESGALIGGFCNLEGCRIAGGATIGPFARLRPGAAIGEDAKIGNFVEVKGAEIGPGAKVSHLSYVGDASVGAGANLGAGTITCNYDGVFKHRTVIGENAFIGSNSALVAPVTIGADALVGSGAVVTDDVPAGDLTVARAKQQNRKGMGARFMQRLRALKAAGKRP